MVIGSVIDRLRMAAQLVYCGIAATDSRTRTTAQRAGLFDRKVRSRRSDRYCVRLPCDVPTVIIFADTSDKLACTGVRRRVAGRDLEQLDADAVSGPRTSSSDPGPALRVTQRIKILCAKLCSKQKLRTRKHRSRCQM